MVTRAEQRAKLIASNPNQRLFRDFVEIGAF